MQRVVCLPMIQKTAIALWPFGCTRNINISFCTNTCSADIDEILDLTWLRLGGGAVGNPCGSCVKAATPKHSLMKTQAAMNRQRGDLNPCGQCPMDFESITLATRSHCHLTRAWESHTNLAIHLIHLPGRSTMPVEKHRTAWWPPPNPRIV